MDLSKPVLVLLGVLAAVGTLVLLSLLLVIFPFRLAHVEGAAMAPTLNDGDHILMNTMTYHVRAPERGDIVALYYPVNPEKTFVKRIIAQETDRVQIIDGRVYVNARPITDDYVPAEFRSHDDWGPQVIPEGYYFVLGDHRNNSSDSRHWGFVPKRYVIARVQARWWPHVKVF